MPRGSGLIPNRKGERRGGRLKGQPNHLTSDTRRAIAEAANNVGRPKLVKGKWVATGEGGMTGYFEWLAVTQPQTFGPILSNIIPAKVEVEGNVTLEALVLGARKALEAEECAPLTIEGKVE